MSDGQASTAFSRADAKRAFGAYVSQFDLDDERIALKVEREKRYPNYTLIGYYTGFAIRFAA